jgi:hypothetical protein
MLGSQPTACYRGDLDSHVTASHCGASLIR